MLSRLNRFLCVFLSLFNFSVAFSLEAPNGFYSTLSMGGTTATKDVALGGGVGGALGSLNPNAPLNSVPTTKDRYVENRDKVFAETASDGYQLNRYLGVEVGVGHVGVVSYDNFFLAARAFYPVLNQVGIYAKGGFIYPGAAYRLPKLDADYNSIFQKSRLGHVLGGGIEYFLSPTLSVHLDYARYYVKRMTTQYQGLGIYQLGPLYTTSLGIHQYIGRCDSRCEAKSSLPWHKGTYLGLSHEAVTAYRGVIKRYSRDDLELIWGIKSYHPYTHHDHDWGFGIRHGYQLTPYFSIELQILHSAVISQYSFKQINFYTVDSRFSLPMSGMGSMNDGGWFHRVRPYAKVGMAYSQESYYLMNVGVGGEVFWNNQLVFNVSWQRLSDYSENKLDTGDARTDYSVLGMGLTYYFYTH